MRYINNINNAEGDAPAKTAPATTPAPVVQKSGMMDTVKGMASNKGLITGAGIGAGLGFLVSWLSGANKITSTIAGAGIFGWAGYAMGGDEKKMGATGDGHHGVMADTSRLYADGTTRGGQSSPRPVNPTQQSNPRTVNPTQQSQGRPNYGGQSEGRPNYSRKRRRFRRFDGELA